jgi:hypothetical protein
MGMITTKAIAELLQSYFKNRLGLKPNFGANKVSIENESNNNSSIDWPVN